MQIYSSTTGLEQNQGTAHVNDRVEDFESSLGSGLGNMLDWVGAWLI